MEIDFAGGSQSKPMAEKKKEDLIIPTRVKQVFRINDTSTYINMVKDINRLGFPLIQMGAHESFDSSA